MSFESIVKGIGSNGLVVGLLGKMTCRIPFVAKFKKCASEKEKES